MPAEEMGAAIKAEKGKFEESADLVKVVESVDIKQPAWAVLLVTDSYRQAPPLAPFDNLTVVAKSGDEGLKYEAKAIGKDAEAVKAAVDQFTSLINEGRGEMTREAERAPTLQPVVDFFNTIELKSDGTNATGTALMKKPAQ
jgi:hypothetical protein